MDARRVALLVGAAVIAASFFLSLTILKLVDYRGLRTREAAMVALAKSWRSGMTIAGGFVRSKQREDGDLRSGAVVFITQKLIASVSELGLMMAVSSLIFSPSKKSCRNDCPQKARQEDQAKFHRQARG